MTRLMNKQQQHQQPHIKKEQEKQPEQNEVFLKDLKGIHSMILHSISNYSAKRLSKRECFKI